MKSIVSKDEIGEEYVNNSTLHFTFNSNRLEGMIVWKSSLFAPAAVCGSGSSGTCNSGTSSTSPCCSSISSFFKLVTACVLFCSLLHIIHVLFHHFSTSCCSSPSSIYHFLPCVSLCDLYSFFSVPDTFLHTT